MSASRTPQEDPLTPPDAAYLHAKFLALKQQVQNLEAENADWNRKKANLKKPRRWSKKRLLVPPALRAKPQRPVGAQDGNENHLKHGKYARDRQLFFAKLRTHIRASYALVAWVKTEFKYPREDPA